MDIDLTNGPLKSHFKRIAIPASIGFLFNTFYNVVDSFYAGRLGTDSLAAMALSFPIFFLVISISSGLGSSSTALTAIAIGKKDESYLHEISKNTFLLGLFFGIVIPILSPFYLPLLFSITGAEDRIIGIGLEYTYTILIGGLFFIMNNIFAGILNAQGITKPFRNFLIFGFILNLVLDPMLMYGWLFLPELGVQGVALATVLIQFFGNIYLFYHVNRSFHFELQIIKTVKISYNRIKEILGQAIPSTLSMATIALGVYIINFFVVLYAGEATVAAYGVSMRIEQIALIPTIGINIAVLSLIGQNFGSGKTERVKESRRKGIFYGVIIMLIGTVIIFPLAPYLIAIFDSSEEVVKAGTTYLRIESIAFTTYVFININVSTLQGIKKPRFAIFLGVYRQILPVFIFYLLGTIFNLGIYGVWIGIVLINWSAVFISSYYTTKQLSKIDVPKIYIDDPVYSTN